MSEANWLDMGGRSVLMLLLYAVIVAMGHKKESQASGGLSDRYRLYQVIGPEGPSDIYEYLRDNDTLWQILCKRNVLYRVVSSLTSPDAKTWIRGDTFYVFAGFVLRLSEVDTGFLVYDCMIYSVFTDSDYNILESTAIDTTCVLRGESLKMLSDSLFRHVKADDLGGKWSVLSFSVDLGKICKDGAGQ